MLKPLKFILVAALSFCSLSAFAEGVQMPQKDDVMAAAFSALPLYESTPDSSLGVKAPQIGWIQKDQHVKILETKQYFSALGGTEIWVEVAKENDPAVKGWILAGLSGGQSKLAKVQPVMASPERELAREAEISKVPADEKDE